MMRIAKNELNIELKSTPRFIGVFEHFYDDSIYQDVSTHYVNLAYEIEIEEKAKLTLDFIKIKTQEYNRLKQEVEDLKQEAKNMDRNLL